MKLIHAVIDFVNKIVCLNNKKEINKKSFDLISDHILFKIKYH